MKKIGWLIVIIIVGFIIVRIMQKSRQTEEKTEEEIPTEVLIEEVRLSDIAQILFYTGNIVGSEQVNVHPIEETGKLMKYFVKEGDNVSKGDTIALVDRSIKGLDFKPAIITSPISGVIGILYLDDGTLVSPAVPVAMVTNIDVVKVEVNIPENDVKYVKLGLKANITVSSYSEDVFIGRLTEISPVLNPISRTTKASIVISNAGHKLRPGMFANVDLIIEEHNNTIIVPEKAVIEKESKKVVFVLKGEHAERREVITGIENDGLVEILNGLEEREKVITLGNYGLKDSAKVLVKNTE